MKRHPAEKDAAGKLGSRELAQTSFAQFERAVVAYLDAADDFASTFVRRGRAAFTSDIAQQEIHSRGVQLSAAFHALNDEGPRYLRDLQAALPKSAALLQDAHDLRGFVLRAVHSEQVRPLNNVVDVINDAKKIVRPKLIEEQMALVSTAAANIQKETVRANEKLDNLRRAFGTAVVSLETSR
jgi:hypothetical protein